MEKRNADTNSNNERPGTDRQVEAACFPAAEAATQAEFEQRLAYYADHFWLMFQGSRLIAFVDGFVTDLPDLTDEMYANARMHNKDGAWQMIFGVNTIPACRGRGYAGQLIQQAGSTAHRQNRRGLVLTCKAPLIPYYAKFGFVDEGIYEKSTHGNAVWHQMRLTFTAHSARLLTPIYPQDLNQRKASGNSPFNCLGDKKKQRANLHAAGKSNM